MATEYSSQDLVMLAGDMNINSAPLCDLAKVVLDAINVEQKKR
jgi:hypothetical protein